MSRNCELGRPVRVIRGYKLKSEFAPEEGYRYDGKYIFKSSNFFADIIIIVVVVNF